MAGSASLKTIAEACRLSVSTVSQILNGKEKNYSSEATKRRVIETARQLGYRRNFGYRLMRGQPTKAVAILTSMRHMKAEEYVRELVMTLMVELDRRGYVCSFSPLEYEVPRNVDKVRELLSRGVEHFIVIGTPVGFREIEELVEADGKLLISTSYSFRRHLSVDVVGGAEKVIRFLYGKGGENFRFLFSGSSISGGDLRGLALQRVFPELEWDVILARYVRYAAPDGTEEAHYADSMYRAGLVGAEKLFRKEPEVCAVCCSIDSMALGAADYLIRSGKVVGRDVLLGGFNNDFGVRNAPFPISSVDHNWSGRGAMLVDAVLTPGEFQRTLEPRVCIREL